MQNNSFSHRLVKFTAKLTACAASFALYSFGVLGGNAVLVMPVYAQSTCSGGHLNCITFFQGKWQNQSTPGASTTVRISDFNFPAVTIDYPVTSINTVQRDTNTINLFRPISSNPGSSISIQATPNSNLVWDATTNAFQIRNTDGRHPSGGENLQYLRLTFTVGTTLDRCSAPVGRGGTTIQGQVPPPATGRTSQLAYGMRICMKAIIVGHPPSNINLPNIPIFDLVFGGIAVGTVNIAGSSFIVPPPPPLPKTCDAYNGGAKIFPLQDIVIDQISTANQESAATYNATQTVQLNNCPAGIRINAVMEDTNNTTSTRDYLINRTGTGFAANAGVRIYYKDTQKVTMKTVFALDNTVSGRNDYRFTAKYFNPVGANLGIGQVQANAKLTLTYP